MIFPLFLFLSGISFAFSLAKHERSNQPKNEIYFKIIKRGILLWILGNIFANSGIRFDFHNMEFHTVLGRIGLSWMFAALIFMNTKLFSRIVIFWGLLIGYWMLMLFFPVNHLGSEDPFSMQGNLMNYLDKMIMAREHTYAVFNIGYITSTCTAFLGMLTGQFILSDYLKNNPLKKVLYMTVAGIGLMIIGQIWNSVFPINKMLWSSSFVCWVGGISLLLFSVFYLVIDVWKSVKWTKFFVVIGMNSITIYLAQGLIGFKYTANCLFGGFINLFSEIWLPTLQAFAYLATGWLFVYWLYKKQIFLKI
jgi:predicted acyltransferase